MTNQIELESTSALSRLISLSKTGNLKSVVRELAVICKETSAAQCSKLSRMMPRLSVNVALHAVRIDP